MLPLDEVDLDVFTGDAHRQPMGIALYKRPTDGVLFAIVGRKAGPKEGYLWQYRLEDNGSGRIKATVVRKFGRWSGKKEIESIAVDNELGYVYYSDEGVRRTQVLRRPRTGRCGAGPVLPEADSPKTTKAFPFIKPVPGPGTCSCRISRLTSSTFSAEKANPAIRTPINCSKW